MRALAFVFLLLAVAVPASARLWKPTQQQQTADYLTIQHNTGSENIVMAWIASPLTGLPTEKAVLDKYILLTIVHSRRGADGVTVWDEVQGVRVSNGAGQDLKEVPSDQVPPLLIGRMAANEATMRQATQGRGKIYSSVWEAGPVNACQRGKLVVSYAGENYSYDTPVPGCP